MEEAWRPVDDIVDNDGNLDGRTLVVKLVGSARHKICLLDLPIVDEKAVRLKITHLTEKKP